MVLKKSACSISGPIFIYISESQQTYVAELPAITPF